MVPGGVEFSAEASELGVRLSAGGAAGSRQAGGGCRNGCVWHWGTLFVDEINTRRNNGYLILSAMSISDTRNRKTMGRIKLWDTQFRIKWLASWLRRLKVVAKAADEDAAAVARRAIEREVEKREKKLRIGAKKETQRK
jgi:hypothetical protein